MNLRLRNQDCKIYLYDDDDDDNNNVVVGGDGGGTVLLVVVLVVLLMKTMMNLIKRMVSRLICNSPIRILSTHYCINSLYTIFILSAFVRPILDCILNA